MCEKKNTYDRINGRLDIAGKIISKFKYVIVKVIKIEIEKIILRKNNKESVSQLCNISSNLIYYNQISTRRKQVGVWAIRKKIKKYGPRFPNFMKATDT